MRSVYIILLLGSIWRLYILSLFIYLFICRYYLKNLFPLSPRALNIFYELSHRGSCIYLIAAM